MADPATLSGAARQFLAQKFGRLFTERETFPIIGANAAQIVGNDPDRLGILIVNLGANNLSVGLRPSVAATSGWLLGSAGGTMSSDVNEDFTFPTRELFGIAPGGNTQLYVLEMIAQIQY